MAHLKVTCQQCSQCERCSSRTKMFVNYCGCNQREIQDRIRTAIHECRTRRGFYVLKNDFLASVTLRELHPALNASSA